MPIQQLLTIIVAVLVIVTVIYFVNRGSHKNVINRGAVVTTGRVIEIEEQSTLLGEIITIFTKIIVEVENNGEYKEYTITTFEKVDFEKDSIIQIIVNFFTGECGLYQDEQK